VRFPAALPYSIAAAGRSPTEDAKGWDVGTVQLFRGDSKAAKGDCVQLSQKLMSQPRLRCYLLILGVVGALAGSAADAQNLDQGKSATRLFADSCAECHRSAPSLARGRSRAQLFQFLQEHYATSSNTAGELASYLASVDTRRSGRPRPATSRSPKPAPSASSN
jgi:mono/diheme cytochrome c family protein